MEKTIHHRKGTILVTPFATARERQWIKLKAVKKGAKNEYADPRKKYKPSI
jgi:hypothetical protein